MKNLAVILITILSITVAEAQQSIQFYVDSLKHELTIAKEDTNKVDLLLTLSDFYVQSSADTGIAYAQQALDLAKKVNFQEGILYAEIRLSTSLTTSGNYPLGLDHAFKTLSLAKKINLAVPQAYALVFWCYYYLGEYKNALKYIGEAMKLGQPWELPYGWRDLAMVYHKLNQSDSALFYAKKAYENLKGSSTEGNIAHILGDAYAGKTNYDSALSFYRNGVSASLKSYAQPTSGTTSTGPADLIDSYNGIAGVYKAMNNFDSAAWYSKKVLAQRIEKEYPIGLLKAANMLADIYGSQHKSDSTLKYLMIALNIKDSLFSREKTMAIQNLAFKEEEKQKEIEASELKYRNQLRTYSLLGGLIALLVIAGILFRNNRNKQKANAFLHQQKEKIESTLTELKSTQAQLIQSEKMASLGELTAGIAHEIQNPLNFVNNFSEVNNELIDEMKEELAIGNKQLAIDIAENIKQNLEKINHHGKRAESIVKGMLLHSRKSTGIKESTDINALADEYFRLAYHSYLRGRQAYKSKVKDSGEIKLITDFDSSLPVISVIPQDIGRVLLNLFNNAFWATNEKSKNLNHKTNDHKNQVGEDQELGSPLGVRGKSLNLENDISFQPPAPKGEQDFVYQPVVTLITKNLTDHIEIRIHDNGPGIPSNLLDKIFQPFFTTKPTGQGTGLGLSLAYDIIKAHGGNIEVKSFNNPSVEELNFNVNQAFVTEFIIELPINNAV